MADEYQQMLNTIEKIYKPVTIKEEIEKTQRYDICPKCQNPLERNKSYISKLDDDKQSYTRTLVMFIKCIKCLNEYKTELRRSNTYIYVPYRVREEARKLGAQFDPELKLYGTYLRKLRSRSKFDY